MTMAKGSTSKTLVWILMGLLILGLGGFGVTNLSGTLRSIGTVGDKEISIDAYARGLQEELRVISAQTGQSVSFAQAQSLGLDRAVLGRVVATRALDAEAAQLGISVGDERLRRDILAIEAFRGLDGGFDREAYRFALDQAGLNEAEFEESIREEAARTLLQGAVVNGSAMPPVFVDTMLSYAAQRRDFTWARLDASLLETPVGTPDEADLAAYYDANIDAFTLPETRVITYAWLSPDMILDSVEVDETTLRQLYDERSDEFLRPEHRLVERLVFPDAGAAAAARAELDNGTATFEDLVAARGLELSDVDLGDVSAADLGEAAEAVFAAASGSIAGPATSDLGPALYRVNAVLPAQETTFEDARSELREELAGERARRVIDAQIEDIDDLLAGGATLEELAQESDMQVGEIAWHAEVDHPIAGYEAFRARAAEVKDGDFPEVERLDDGGIFALRLERVDPARPAPLDDVRDEVAAAWQQHETLKALAARAEADVAAIKGGAGFADRGLTATEEIDVTRFGFIAGTPAGLLPAVFEMEKGEIRTLNDGGQVLILQLGEIAPPDMGNVDNNALRLSLDEQLAAGLAQDLFEIYAADIQTRAGITLDQRAINAVHAQFQ